MSRRRNSKFLILLILADWMHRRYRARGTAGFALQALAHRLTRSAHVSAGLHLRSQQLFVTIFFKFEEFQRARLERLIKLAEHPGDRVGYVMSLHNSQQLTVGQFTAVVIDEAEHISELHQTNVGPEIDKFLQPRLPEQVQHSKQKLICWMEAG